MDRRIWRRKTIPPTMPIYFQRGIIILAKDLEMESPGGYLGDGKGV